MHAGPGAPAVFNCVSADAEHIYFITKILYIWCCNFLGTFIVVACGTWKGKYAFFVLAFYTCFKQRTLQYAAANVLLGLNSFIYEAGG